MAGDCTPSVQYGHVYFWTKGPDRLSLLTSLFRIFDFYSWLNFWLSIILVVIILILTSILGKHYNMETELDDVVLIPFRFVKVLDAYTHCSTLGAGCQSQETKDI